jgi:hypothetical protein
MKRKRQYYGYGGLKVGRRRNVKTKTPVKAQNAAYMFAAARKWRITTRRTPFGLTVMRIR